MDWDLAPERLPGHFGFGGNVNLKDSVGPLDVNDWAEFNASARSVFGATAPAGLCACGRDLTLDELC